MGAFIGSLSEKKDALELKMAIYIVIGILVIVLVNLLLDGIRKVIRGLDTAALGGLLLFIGTKVSSLKILGIVAKLLYLVGGTLFVVGIIIFAVLRLFKRKRAKKAQHNQDISAPDSL